MTDTSESDDSMPGLASASTSSDSMPELAEFEDSEDEENTKEAIRASTAGKSGKEKKKSPAAAKAAAKKASKNSPGTDESKVRRDLVEAASSGNLAGVKKAVEELGSAEKTLDLTLTNHKFQDTALVAACRRDHSVCAKFLLDKGASPNAVAGDGSSPLGVAAVGGFEKTTEILVSHGADVHQVCTVSGSRVGHFVAQDSGADDFFDGTPLAQAIKAAGSPTILDILLKGGAKPSKGDAHLFGKIAFYEVLDELAEIREKAEDGWQLQTERNLAGALDPSRTSRLRTLARGDDSEARDFERRRRKAQMMRCELLLDLAGVDFVAADFAPGCAAKLPPSSSSSSASTLPSLKAINLIETCLDLCTMVYKDHPLSERVGGPLRSDVKPFSTKLTAFLGSEPNYREALVVFQLQAWNGLCDLLEHERASSTNPATLQQCVEGAQHTLDALLAFKEENTWYSLMLEKQPSWRKLLEEDIAGRIENVCEKLVAGGAGTAAAKPSDSTLLQVRTAAEREKRVAKDQASAAAVAGTARSSSSSSSDAAGNAAETKSFVEEARLRELELKKSSGGPPKAKKSAEEERGDADRRKKELEDGRVRAENDKKRKDDRDAAEKARKEQLRVREEAAKRQKQLKDAWSQADKACRTLESKPRAELRNGREWMRIQQDLGVEASDDEKDDDDDATEAAAADDGVDSREHPPASEAMHPEVLVTEAVVSWLKRRARLATPAAEAARAAITATMEKVANGDPAVSRVASAAQPSGLTGGTFEVRVCRISGGKRSLIWSAHELGGEAASSGGKKQALVWLVVKRSSEAKYLELVEDSLSRREATVTAGASGLAVQLSEEDAVFLAPGRNRPTLVYSVPTSALNDVTMSEEEQKSSLATRLAAKDFKPRLRLTTREREALGHVGAPAMVLGRSGTGKTLIIVERIRRDRDLDATARHIFTARSTHLVERIADNSLSKPGEAAKARSTLPADDGRADFFLTNEELHKVLDRKAKPAPKQQSFDDGAKMDYTKFLEFFWNKQAAQVMGAKSKLSLQPAQVWVQIHSFIKGSTNATLAGRPLTKKEYDTLIGDRRAGNLSDEERAAVYKLFESYQRTLGDLESWDASDKEVSLVQRILVHGWQEDAQGLETPPADRCYCDEVQDMTQATLLLLLLCCGNRPENLFICGDTAQAIHDGVAFRFSDMRQSVYELRENVAKKAGAWASKSSAAASSTAASRAVTLTRNYRTHAGTLRLANQSLDLLKGAFPTSLDVIEHDIGYTAGPRPLYASAVDAASVLLSPAWQDAEVLFRTEVFNTARKKAQLDADRLKERTASRNDKEATMSEESKTYDLLEVKRNEIYLSGTPLRAKLEAEAGKWAMETVQRRQKRDAKQHKGKKDSAAYEALRSAAAARNAASDAMKGLPDVNRKVAAMRRALEEHRNQQNSAPPAPAFDMAQAAAAAAAAEVLESNDPRQLLARIPGLRIAEQRRYADMLAEEEVDFDSLLDLTPSDWTDMGFKEHDMEIANELTREYLRVKAAAEAADAPPPPVAATPARTLAACYAEALQQEPQGAPHKPSKVSVMPQQTSSSDKADSSDEKVDEAAQEARVTAGLEREVSEMCKREGASLDKLKKHTREKKKKKSGASSSKAPPKVTNRPAPTTTAEVLMEEERLALEKEAEEELGKLPLGASVFEVYRCISDAQVRSRAFSISEYKGLEKEAIAIVDFFGSASNEVVPGWKALFAAAAATDDATRKAKFDEAGRCKPLERDLKLLYTALTRCRSRLIIVEQNPSNGAARSAISYFSNASRSLEVGSGDTTLAEKYVAPSPEDAAANTKRELLPDEWRSRGAQMARVASSAEGADRAALLKEARDAFKSANEETLAKRCEVQEDAIQWLKEVRDLRSQGSTSDKAALAMANVAATHVNACIANLAIPEAIELCRAADNADLGAKLEAMLRNDFVKVAA